jgi:NAD(P)-dependent dehydrogenase (short-subunit alcohol dehydrogenase family)
VVAVTGASGGVGRAVAREFGKHAAAVGLIARGQAGLRVAAEEVEGLGGTAYAHQADVADFEQVRAAAAAIEERLGPIDVWVNNAMTTVFAFVDDIDPQEFERATRVTYLGAVWGTKVALERMLPRDRGTIVQVGSALAYRGILLQAPHCGAKHAMKGFFESLRCELRHRGSKLHRFDGAAAANLFDPVDDDHDEGAHGIFDRQSHRRSAQAWLSRHRLGSGLAATAAMGAAAAALLLHRRAPGPVARPAARPAP